jgi:pheromone shutdown protein TraB
VITLLGVGHVFDLQRSVRAQIHARRPRVVALELDAGRYAFLLNRSRPRPRPSLFGLLARFQSRLAQEYGVQVGDEMVAAAKAAGEIGSEVALIDRDSRVTLQRAWQGMSFQERVRLLTSVVASLLVRRKRVEAELDRFYEDERAYIEQFAAELPTVKRVLIDERDALMAEALRSLHGSRGDVVAVVGDGHVEGLRRLLAGLPVEVVRLKEMQRVSPAAAASGTAASESVTYRL